MTVEFYINNDDMFERSFWFEKDWTAPVLPRIGESFFTNFFFKFVNPAKFYNCLTIENKLEWDNFVKSEMTKEDISGYDAEYRALKAWLNELPHQVKDVCWTSDDYGEIRAVIYL